MNRACQYAVIFSIEILQALAAGVASPPDFLELDKLLGTMIVMGGGYLGCELACMAAMLGTKVTIVELLEDVLLLLDADVRREVKMHMEKNLRVRILTGKALEGVKATEKSVTGKVGNETVSAELLLVSVGRKPVTDELKLENAGVKIDDKGYIPVDDLGRTNVASVYAIGDVTGRMQLAPNANSQDIIAAENATGRKPRKYESLMPGVIFTVPEVVLVGLTEDEAKRQGCTIVTGKFRLSGLSRAIVVSKTAVFVKWIVDSLTDQLLGAAAVGAHVTELIAEATLAIRSELTTREAARTIHAHPTFSEVWTEAAHAPPQQKRS